MNVKEALLIHLDAAATPAQKGQATKLLKAAGRDAVQDVFWTLSATQEQNLQPLLKRLFK